MEITTKKQKDYYNDTTTLHTIKLEYLNLGNNFTFEHFEEALIESGYKILIEDYLDSQECTDEYIITAQGNYGTVTSLIHDNY